MDRQSNQEVRQMKADTEIPFWRIAERLGIHENTLLRWMRTELSEEKKAAILFEIKNLHDERLMKNDSNGS